MTTPVPLCVAVCSLLLLWETPAQEPEPVDVHALARRFRTGDLSEDGRRAVAEELLAEGERGAAPLFNAVRVELEARGRRYRKDVARFLRDFERAAPAVLRRRMGREGPRRVEVLREEVLTLSRGGDLQKETIPKEIDPRMAELRELLTLEPEDVFAAVESLRDERERLQGEAEALIAMFGYRERAEVVLLRTDSGRRLVELYPLADDPRGFPDELAAGLAQRAWLATPMSGRDERVLNENAAIVESIEPEERAGIRELNRIRVLAGLPVLAIDVKLCAAGRGHSEDMVRLGFFSHTSPVPGKETPGKRAALAGTSGGAENIAAGQATGLGAIRAWWYSPGHHRNMMSGASRVGLGRHRDHWTQMFGG